MADFLSNLFGTDSSQPLLGGPDFGNRLDSLFLAMASTPPGGQGGIPLIQATQVANQQSQLQAQRQAATWMLESMGGFTHDQAVKLGANPQIAQMAMQIGHSKQMSGALNGIFPGSSPDASPQADPTPSIPQAPAMQSVSPQAALPGQPDQAQPQLAGGSPVAPMAPAASGQPTPAPISSPVQPSGQSADNQVRPQVQAWQAKAQDVAQRAVGVQQTPQGPVAVDAKGKPLINLSALLKAGMQFSVGGWTDQERKTGENLTNLAQKMIETGTQPSANGGVIPIQGAAEAKAREEGMKDRERYRARADYQYTDYQPVPGGPTYKVTNAQLADLMAGKQGQQNPSLSADQGGSGQQQFPGVVAKQPETFEHGQKQLRDDFHTMTEQFGTRQLSRERLQEISNILQTYQPGAFAQQKAQIVASLRSVGIPVPDTATANPAAFEQFLKNATANVFNQVKDMGGRVLQSEIIGLTKANANPELQPEAARAIVGQGIGLINAEDQHYKDFSKWYDEHPTAYDRSKFDIDWYSKHPYGSYTKAAQDATPALGERIPAPDQRPQGKVFMTPKLGPAVWNGHGWVKVTQTQNGWVPAQ